MASTSHWILKIFNISTPIPVTISNVLDFLNQLIKSQLTTVFVFYLAEHVKAELSFSTTKGVTGIHMTVHESYKSNGNTVLTEIIPDYII